MIRNRSTRAVATLAITLALAVSALVGPAAVLAGRPAADATATPVLDRVSPSIEGGQASYIAYDLHFDLDDNATSNLAQLYLMATTPAGWDLWAVHGATRPGCDDTGVNLFCSFGAMDADDTPIDLTVVYKLGTSTGSVTIDFLWNTTGVAGDKNGKSHGDSYKAAATVVVENDADFGASYPQAAGDVIADDSNLSRRNPQYTKVTSPAANIVVTVSEESDITQCQALFAGCFGQASVLNVDNGNDELGTIVGEIGINANRPNGKFVHFFDPGVTDPITGLAYEELPTCGETPVAPCASVTTNGGKTFVVVYLTQNGKIMGH